VVARLILGTSDSWECRCFRRSVMKMVSLQAQSLPRKSRNWNSEEEGNDVCGHQDARGCCTELFDMGVLNCFNRGKYQGKFEKIRDCSFEKSRPSSYQQIRCKHRKHGICRNLADPPSEKMTLKRCLSRAVWAPQSLIVRICQRRRLTRSRVCFHKAREIWSTSFLTETCKKSRSFW
jgi:hypothetical protein